MSECKFRAWVTTISEYASFWPQSDWCQTQSLSYSKFRELVTLELGACVTPHSEYEWLQPQSMSDSRLRALQHQPMVHSNFRVWTTPKLECNLRAYVITTSEYEPLNTWSIGRGAPSSEYYSFSTQSMSRSKVTVWVTPRLAYEWFHIQRSSDSRFRLQVAPMSDFDFKVCATQYSEYL